MEKRLNKIILLIGRRGCGKTTFCKELIKKSPLKTVVLDTFDHPDYRYLPPVRIDEIHRWKNGHCRVISGDPVENLQKLFNKVHNAMIVAEDSRRYIEPTVQKPVRQGIVEHRNRNIDLIFMFHSLKDVPPYICSMHNDVVLFKTNENVDIRQDKWSNWDTLAAAHKRVMANPLAWYNETINLQ